MKKRKKRPIKKYRRKIKAKDTKTKAMAFVDGFNLFHALKKCEPQDRWCNIRKLIEDQISDDSIELVSIWWFTAYYKKRERSVSIHKNYAAALDTVSVQRFLGEYNSVSRVFSSKNHKITSIDPVDFTKNGGKLPSRIEYKTEEEKKTDVNIAVKIIEGAFLNYYDIAYIVSGDSDLYNAINIARKNFKEKKFINILPPFSKGRSMKNICDKQISLGRLDVKAARFPDEINLANGTTIKMPRKYLESK